MIEKAYETGNATLVCQAKADIQDIGGGKSEIIVTELPFQVQKTTILERIAASRERFNGITDVRDEFDFNGMRVVFEVARGSDPEEVLGPPAQLYRHARQPVVQRAGAGVRRGQQGQPAQPDPAGYAARVYQPPLAGHYPPLEVRAEPGRSAPAHPGRAAQGAQQDRRGHRHDPQIREYRHRPREPDEPLQAERASGPGHPGYAPAPPGRPGAAETGRRAQRAGRPGEEIERNPGFGRTPPGRGRRRNAGYQSRVSPTRAAPSSWTPKKATRPALP